MYLICISSYGCRGFKNNKVVSFKEEPLRGGNWLGEGTGKGVKQGNRCKGSMGGKAKSVVGGWRCL